MSVPKEMKQKGLKVAMLLFLHVAKSINKNLPSFLLLRGPARKPLEKEGQSGGAASEKNGPNTY